MASIRLFSAALSVAVTWPIAGLSFDPKIMKSVVAVIPERLGQLPRGGTGTRDAPEGTAVAVFEGGYLATNAHVLGRAVNVDIRLANGRLVAVEVEAVVVDGGDVKGDVAEVGVAFEGGFEGLDVVGFLGDEGEEAAASGAAEGGACVSFSTYCGNRTLYTKKTQKM